AHLTRAQQDADPEIVHARVVADDGEAGRAARGECRNQFFWYAAQPEAAHHNGRAVGNERHPGVGARDNLVHRPAFSHVRSRSSCTQTSNKPSASTSRSSPKAARRSWATTPRRRSPTSS